jgi:vacuolar protein sorting-associated protein IST1
MEMKKMVVKEIAAENNALLDFSEFQEVVELDGSSNVPHYHELNHEAIYQTDMDESSESDSLSFSLTQQGSMHCVQL